MNKLSSETELKGGAKSEVFIIITVVILVLIFAVLPAIAIIVGGIMLVVSRGEYRRLLSAIVAVAAVTLVSFIIMAICFIALA